MRTNIEENTNTNTDKQITFLSGHSQPHLADCHYQTNTETNMHKYT